MTSSLAEVIIKNPNETEILKTAKAQGMVSMEEDSILKLLKGVTSFEEIMRVIEEK